MDIAGFKKLQIWQKAMTLSADIYETTKKIPEIERYGIISQMRRCAVSVPSNIAEGYGRYSDNELVHFLKIARGSLYELITQASLCLTLGYIGAEDLSRIERQTEEIDRMTIAFINKMNGMYK